MTTFEALETLLKQFDQMEAQFLGGTSPIKKPEMVKKGVVEKLIPLEGILTKLLAETKDVDNIKFDIDPALYKRLEFCKKHVSPSIATKIYKVLLLLNKTESKGNAFVNTGHGNVQTQLSTTDDNLSHILSTLPSLNELQNARSSETQQQTITTEPNSQDNKTSNKKIDVKEKTISKAVSRKTKSQPKKLDSANEVTTPSAPINIVNDISLPTQYEPTDKRLYQMRLRCEKYIIHLENVLHKYISGNSITKTTDFTKLDQDNGYKYDEIGYITDENFKQARIKRNLVVSYHNQLNTMIEQISIDKSKYNQFALNVINPDYPGVKDITTRRPSHFNSFLSLFPPNNAIRRCLNKLFSVEGEDFINDIRNIIQSP